MFEELISKYVLDIYSTQISINSDFPKKSWKNIGFYYNFKRKRLFLDRIIIESDTLKFMFMCKISFNILKYDFSDNQL